jgi:hypothetical protein
MANSRQPFREAIHSLITALQAPYINLLERPTFEEPRGRETAQAYLVDTGTHACMEWQRGDNIRLFCVTSARSELFWEIVKEDLMLGDKFKEPKNDILELSDYELHSRVGVHPLIREIGVLCQQNEVQPTTPHLTL